MGVKEKIAKAKKTNWVAEGISKSEVKSTIEWAKISAKIEMARLEKGMTQIEFAEYMGVTQGMVSKWESREYNFTIKSLNEICEKLDLELSVCLNETSIKNEYEVIPWKKEVTKKKNPLWFKGIYGKEDIA